MANLLSKTSDTSPTSDDVAYTITDPTGTPADRKTTLGNIITKAHGLSDEMVKVSSGVMTAATAGTDYYKPGGTDVAITDGGTGASSATAGFDALSPLTTQGDILYHNGVNNVRLPKGNAAEVLRMNGAGTVPEWAAGAGGGQTLYDHVVAASGGTHTTLQSALDSATSGDTIFVRSGSYALVANKTMTSALNNVTIIGENPESAIIDLVSYTLLFQGTNINFRNIAFTRTTGKLEFSGVEPLVMGCHFNSTSATAVGAIVSSGANARFENNLFEATAEVSCFIETSGYYAVIVGNAFKSTGGHTSTTSGFINMSGHATQVAGNTFTAAPVSTGEYPFIYTAAPLANITGNTFYPSVGYRMTGIIMTQSGNVTGNFFYDCLDGVKSTASGSCQINSNFFGEVGSGRNPIYCAASNSIISGNLITNPKTTGVQIRLVAADRCTVSGNFISGGDTGVSVDSNSTETLVSGNHIAVNNNNGTGINFSGNNASASGNYIYITNNTGTYGIYTNNLNVNCSGNTIKGSSDHGTGIFYNSSATLGNITGNHIASCNGGINVGGGDGYIIVGNTMNTIGSAGSLVITGEKHTIQNNIISDTGDTYSDVEERKVLRVKNTSGVSVSAGDIVTRKAVAAGNEFTTSTTAGDPKVLGMALETIANNAIGYVLIKGKTVSLKVDGTTDIAIGDFISQFTTAGIGKKASTGETAIAIALEAYTTDNSSGVIDAILIDPRTV